MSVHGHAGPRRAGEGASPDSQEEALQDRGRPGRRAQTGRQEPGGGEEARDDERPNLDLRRKRRNSTQRGLDGLHRMIRQAGAREAEEQETDNREQDEGDQRKAPPEPLQSHRRQDSQSAAVAGEQEGRTADVTHGLRCICSYQTPHQRKWWLHRT